MKASIWLFIAMLPGPSWAGASDVCAQHTSATLIKKIPLPPMMTSSYFVRPLKNSRKISFIYETKPEGSGNMVLDLDTGHFQKVPGELDPETLAGDSVLATPIRDANNVFRMSFFKLDATTNEKSKPLFVDHNNTGDYESVSRAIVDGKTSSNYMLSANGEGVQIRRYVTDSSGKVPRVSVESTTTLCPGKNLSLPMINKNGVEFSAYDTDLQQTVIGKVANCVYEEKFNYLMGKMDFSPDGRKVAFQVSELFRGPKKHEGITFGGPTITSLNAKNPKQLNRAYVYDRDTGQVEALSAAPLDNVYYPVFLNNGDLAFMSYDEHGKGSVSVVRLNEPSGTNRVATSCAGQQKIEDSLIAIGAIYSALCRPSDTHGSVTSSSGSYMMALSLGAKKCRGLVSGNWARLKSTIIAEFAKHEAETESAKIRRRNPKDPLDTARYNPHERVPSKTEMTSLTENDLLAACPK